MKHREPGDDLLEQLSADAPLRRMRARLDRAIAEAPSRRGRPAGWLIWVAAAAVIVAVVVLRPRSPAPPEPELDGRRVLAMLDAPSTFDRLRAVNAAAALPAPLVGDALLERLETDESVIVRLSALDALAARDLPPAQAARLVAALPAQPTAIVQAHLGRQLRRHQRLTRVELERLLGHARIHAEARDALIRLEES